MCLDKPQGPEAWMQVVHTYRRPSCCSPDHLTISMGASTSLTWLVSVNTMKVTYGFSSRTNTTNVSFLPAAKVCHTTSTLQKGKEKNKHRRCVIKSLSKFRVIDKCLSQYASVIRSVQILGLQHFTKPESFLSSTKDN